MSRRHDVTNAIFTQLTTLSMSNNNESDGPWVIIPPTVLADERLSAGEKLVYGRVFGFIKRHGYCNGTNDYLAKYIGMSRNTVKSYLKRLYALGYLRYEVLRGERGEVQERRIFPQIAPSGVTPLGGNSTPPLGGNSTPPRVTPRVSLPPKERRDKEVKNVKGKDEKEIEYFADLLADKLNDQKSISFYKLACRHHDPHALLRKASEIVGDGGARNPASVFTKWVGALKKRPL